MVTLDKLRSLSVEHKVRMLVKSEVKTVGGSEFRNRLSKVSVIIARIGFHYAQYVDATRLLANKPATFEAKPRKWGTRVGATVSHNEQDYVETMPLETINVRYFVDNDEVPYDSIKEHIYVAPSKAQEEHQGLDKSQLVIVRDYKWSNVVSIEYVD